jgi:hypothetical protein
MVQNANLDDDDAYTDLTSYSPWPIHTPVLLEFVSGWYEGEIIDFGMLNSTSGWYQISWTDGTIGTYTDFGSVDEMVENAQDYDPWTVGTPVYNLNGELDEQMEANLGGSIQAFEGGQYSIQWSNGQVKQYRNFDDVDDMVEAAYSKNEQDLGNDDDDDDDEPWENGTPVSYEFDDGWWDGTITSFNLNDQTYDITWSDGSVETYSDLDKVDEMVYNAQDDEADDDVNDDSIEDDTDDSIDDSIEEDTDDSIDDSIEEDNVDQEMDAMVAAGAPPHRMSQSSIAVLSCVVLGLTFAIAAYFIKRLVQRKRTNNETTKASVQEVQELEIRHNGFVA